MNLDHVLAYLDEYRDEYDRLQRSEARALKGIELLQAELDVMSRRLDDLLNLAEDRHEFADAERRSELHQAKRRLATALEANQKLSAKVAGMQDQVRKAEQMAEDSRRALVDHAGRT